MATQSSTQNPWADDEHARILRLRMRTFWNLDYFEKIVLPLLDFSQGGQVLDVGCGNGGLSILLSEMRPDLMITGVDSEPTYIKDAKSFAVSHGFKNLNFEQGDAHQFRFSDGMFDGVVCQTVLTHVREAQTVIKEMARVLKPGGVFFAAEYTDTRDRSTYDNVNFEKCDEAWHREYYRISRLYFQGKNSLGRGDDRLGVRVPILAAQAGLDVYDVRLNDRAMHVIPPYRHEKQKNYLELLKAANAPDKDDKWLRITIEYVVAGGGTEEDGRWLYGAIDSAGIVQAIDDGNFTATGSFPLYLTFAKKP